MDIVLANPRGFCAGVERAIAMVERALERFGRPVYVRHEVVHNRHVVADLKAKGAIFIEDLAEVPDGATLIFSAHGVPQSVRQLAAARNLNVYDATCPLVTKVHLEVSRLRQQGYEIIMIGHKGHPEVEGTMGQADGGMYLVECVADVSMLQVGAGGSADGSAPGEEPRLAFVTQTTLSVDDATAIVNALKARFPNITGPRKDDICYATQNRQDAIKIIARKVEVMLVVGSINSSNSNRLREVAENQGARALLIDDAGNIDASLLANCRSVGVTAGASAPEVLVQGVIQRLVELGGQVSGQLEQRSEGVVFALPKDL
ncbi:4-hydroxy-3-methylbut-2-enyl diphosphate reductase [Propionivibrio sp.]|uniref:4-hydroxy-3-methylbut-2-enyl diphosphate reductase n=1 Tax=Propionivibrio sp. TaxID=2212460 RepID=UPI003BF32A45